jgi:hypothetical protein
MVSISAIGFGAVLTNFPQLDTPRRMGRKPIKANLLMKQFTHWLDPEVMERVHAEVGKQKVSEFMREAIANELKRRAKLKPGKGAAEDGE